MVTLEEISRSNIEQIRELQLKNEQLGFLLTNDEALEQAALDTNYKTYAVVFMEQPIGFIMLDQHNHSAPVLSSLMIEANIQGNGFGRQALDALLYRLRADGRAETLCVHVHKRNEVAKALLASVGFVEKEELPGNQLCMELQVQAGPYVTSLRQLGVSQLFLCREELARLSGDESNAPLHVADLGLGFYVLIGDLHAASMRLYRGDTKAAVVVDTLSETQQRELVQKVQWAGRFDIGTLESLCERVVGQAAFRRLWLRRLERMQALLQRFTAEQCEELQEKAPEFILYGASADGSVLYFEDAMGVPYFYDRGVLYDETTVNVASRS